MAIWMKQLKPSTRLMKQTKHKTQKARKPNLTRLPSFKNFILQPSDFILSSASPATTASTTPAAEAWCEITTRDNDCWRRDNNRSALKEAAWLPVGGESWRNRTTRKAATKHVARLRTRTHCRKATTSKHNQTSRRQCRKSAWFRETTHGCTFGKKWNKQRKNVKVLSWCLY